MRRGDSEGVLLRPDGDGQTRVDALVSALCTGLAGQNICAGAGHSSLTCQSPPGGRINERMNVGARVLVSLKRTF